MKIPENNQTVMPYLIIKDAANFIEFMQKVFDAKETHITKRDDHTIKHGEIMVKDCTIMFADSTTAYSVHTSGLFIYVEDVDETYNKAMEEGATSIMELGDESYGRTAGIEDPFGNVWWITSPKK